MTIICPSPPAGNNFVQHTEVALTDEVFEEARSCENEQELLFYNPDCASSRLLACMR
jgi:hypothetical protein